MSSPRFLYFDLGSTLLDETAAHHERAVLTCSRLRTLGLEMNAEDFLARMTAIGRVQSSFPYKTVLAALLAAHPPEAFGFAMVEYRNDGERLHEGVPAMLALLAQSYRLGVLANQAAGTEERLRAHGIRDWFEVVVASAEFGYAKPSPEIFTEAERRAGCRGGELVMIGDRLDYDIRPARARGWRTVRVRQGFAGGLEPATDAERPDVSVSRVTDVPSALERL